MRIIQLVAIAAAIGASGSASAQRTNENAVTAAQDAFGVSVGTERIGIYNDREIRGSSPVTAGNVRVEGIYIDLQGQLNTSLTEGNTIRVGLSALNSPFPAPSGVVDYRIRDGSGERAISSTLQMGSYNAAGFEMIGYIPIGEKLSIMGAAALRRSAQDWGNVNRTFNFGIAGRWKPSPSIQIVPFAGYSRNLEDVQPTVFVSGSYLPRKPKDETFGQIWARDDRVQANIGFITTAELSKGVMLQVGVFNSRSILQAKYSDLYRNATREGFADHVISADPEQRRVSTSGEIRATWKRRTGALAHVVHLMARGRDAGSRYGGSSSAPLGIATVGVFQPTARPVFKFRPQSEDRVNQITGGLGYHGSWTDIGEISVGIQKSAYKKVVETPDAGSSRTSIRPWLYNAGGAVYFTPRLSLYGALTRGMEENGTAPDAAANRGEPLESAITNQRELGFRYRLSPDIQMTGGVFELRKPYFGLDTRNVFGRLGSLKTSGVELSAAGRVASGLNVVAGAVLMNPRVGGEAVEFGRLGEGAVAKTRRLIRINADYRLPFWTGASVDAGLVHLGPVIASARPDPLTGKQLSVPDRTVLDLGGRYRFRLGAAPAVVRLRIINLTNAKGWKPTSSGGLEREDPRRAIIQISADFQ